jgi:MFS family permease
LALPLACPEGKDIGLSIRAPDRASENRLASSTMRAARLPRDHVLRRRNFRLLLAAQSVSFFGDYMVVVALAFAALELGGGATGVGVVLACMSISRVATVLLGGVVADRTSRRSVMVAADCFRVVTQGLTAALVLIGTAKVWMLALLAAATGAGTGFFLPASGALLPDVVPPEDLQPANGLRATANSLGQILGPLAAGVLVAVASAGWALAIDAATFAISAAFLSQMHLTESPPHAAGSFLSELRDGWGAFRARTWVWTCVACAAAVNFLYGAWEVLGPVVARNDLGGAAVWGTLLAMFGVGALVGSLVATRLRPVRPLVFAVIAWSFFALPLAFLAAGVSVVALAGATFLSGAGLVLGGSVWESTLQLHLPPESLARVLSYDQFGSFAAYPLGLAVWGPIAAAIGISVSLWLAYFLFVGLLLALLAVPAVRNLPRVPEAARALFEPGR